MFESPDVSDEVIKEESCVLGKDLSKREESIIFCMFLRGISTFWLVRPGVTVLWCPVFAAFFFDPISYTTLK